MDFVAYDLETTGIDPSQDHVVEIGAVKFNDFKPVETYSTLVDPGLPIPKEAVAVHGIDDKMVEGQPVIQDVLAPFADFCGDLTLVAHNARFDFRFLTRLIVAHNTPAPSGVTLDTFSLSKKVFTSLPNHRLSTLVKHLKIESKKFHRAEQDAAYCGMLFVRILEILIENNQAVDVASLALFSDRKEMKFPQVKHLDQGQLGLF